MYAENGRKMTQIGDLQSLAERPTMREWLKKVQEAKPIRSRNTAAEVIRKIRDSR
jgi:hypothetical protein